MQPQTRKVSATIPISQAILFKQLAAQESMTIDELVKYGLDLALEKLTKRAAPAARKRNNA